MKITLFIVLILAGVWMIFYWLQDNFIFFPEKLKKNYQFRFSAPFSERFFESKEGGMVNVLVFEGEVGKGKLVYYHGNAGSLRTWGAIASAYAAMGYEVWVMDYRGYGKSKGTRTEKWMNEDALLVYDEAANGTAQQDIVVYGRSLGAAFASFVASERKPGKVVLESPFYGLADVADAHVPFLPMRLLLKYKFPVSEYVRKLNGRLLVVHGSEDRVVPLQSSEKLKPNLKPDDRFVVIEGGGHNDLSDFESFRKITAGFLENRTGN
jgi:alpha-beta hydrolase superfamily lysophospholipase